MSRLPVFFKPMKSKIYNITNLGDIEVCKHHNTKRLVIKLKLGKTPKVIIPKLMTYEMGYRFAVEKKEWIKKHTQKLKELKPTIIYDQSNPFTTKFHSIKIKHHTKSTIETIKTNDEINIFIPETENISSIKTQETIKKIIVEVLRFEAKKQLIPRTIELAKNYGFTINNIMVKNLKSRWGSCSAKNNINLNLHLVRLPEYLSDFIILHELCHTVHKNHGVHFHNLLSKIVGDEKPLNKELKKYNTQI